jgi:hypothetical protein
MDEAQRRKAANEAVFREVNERIEAIQRSFAVTQDEPLHIICECDRIGCTERLHVPVEAYERVRQDFASFVVNPGHVDESVEEVVDTGGDYLVVRKRPGEPQEIAAETNPRA